MTVTFMLSVDYPMQPPAQGDLGEFDVEVTEEEYDLLRQWAEEGAEPGDYPELDRIWEQLYSEAREVLENDEFINDPHVTTWDPKDLGITIQYPEFPD